MKKITTVLVAVSASLTLLAMTACSNGGNGTTESAASTVSGGGIGLFNNVPSVSQTTSLPAASVPVASVPVASVPASSVPSASEPPASAPSLPPVQQGSGDWDESDWDESDWDESDWDESDWDVSPATPKGKANPAYAGTYYIKVSPEYQKQIDALSDEQKAIIQQVLQSTLILGADGSVTISSMGQNATGSWWDNGNGTITLSAEGSEMTYTYQNGMIYDPNDTSTYFQKG